MSTLAKIFVVVNLLLTIALVGALAALLAQEDNYRIKFENEVDRRAAEVSSLEAQAARLESEKQDLDRQNRSLHQRYEDAIGRWENARERNKELETEQAALNAKLERLETSYSNIDERIQEVVQDNTRLQGEIRRREQERDSALDAQRQAEELYLAMVVELEDAEERLQKYGEEREMLRKDLADKQLELAARMRDPTGTTMVVAPPPIDGRVLAVSADVGLVLLSVGKDDRVQEGHVFTVFRGSEYVGKVRVQDVFKDQSSAKIVGEYQRMTPREGDNVSTRIY